MISQYIKYITTNFWKLLFIVLGIIPFGFIIPLLTLYINACIELGYYPTYNNPASNHLFVYKYYSPIINSSGEMWICSLLIWVLISIIYIIIKRKNIKWKLILFSSIGQVLAIILFLSGIMEWFMD